MQYELFAKSELVSCILSQDKFLAKDSFEHCKGFIKIMDQVDLFLDSCKNYLHRF